MKLDKVSIQLVILILILQFNISPVFVNAESSNDNTDTQSDENVDRDINVDKSSDRDNKENANEENLPEDESENTITEENDSNNDNSEKSNDEELNNDEIDKEKETFSNNTEEPDVLKKGVRDDRVITLKENLATIGFPVPGNGTSLFGKKTEVKVKEFQDYYSMTVNGVVDNTMEEKIEGILSSPLQKGKRHEDTVQLKKDLKFLGSPVPGKGTTLYGSETEKVVKSFQKKNNLVVNGIADEVTLAKIEELKEVPLKRGMRREDVKTLKEDLSKLGFTVPGDGTNLFGKQTEAKVKEFQKYYGLKVTGTVADNTKEKIETVLNSPLQKGKRHEDTVQLKKDLKYIGSPVPGKGTTLFGSDTEKVVRSFQKKNGLAVNGIADEVTLAKIEELKEGPLKKGMRREDVKTLKKDLSKLGFTVPGSGTNLYGKNTEKKVREFQKYYGMTADGVAGESTFEKIESILDSPLQKGKRHEDTVQLKKDLKYLGSPVPGKGTTLFGSETEKVVRSFQKKNGLAVNGIADKVTLAKIEELIEGPLKKGMRREDVKTLKKDLAKLGFTVPGNGTNLYGKNTEKKVKEFQKYYGLNANGVAEDSTFEKIESILDSPLQKGKRHEDTVQLKKDLKYLGNPVPGKGTTLFGSETEKVVRSFQKKNGLAINGIADKVTLAKIEELKEAPLSRGMRREDVKQLKKDLAKLDFAVPGNGTNLYGKNTEKKVKAFQKYYGIKQTGTVNKTTQNKIDEVLNSPLQKDKRHADTKKLKRDLGKLGFKVPGNGTTLYGTKTEKKVKEFQKYYSLRVNGIADSVTLKKIKDVLNSPLQNGKRHADTKQLKKDLAKIGYKVPGNGTTLYGDETEKQVRKLQKDHGLAVNGIADEVTLQKIKNLVKNSKPDVKTTYTDYKLSLNKALDEQLKQPIIQTDLHRGKTVYVHSDYLRLTNKAKVSTNKANLRSSTSMLSNKQETLEKGDTVQITGYEENGESFAGNTEWYQVKHENKSYYVHSTMLSGNTAVATTRVNVRVGAGTNHQAIAQLNKNQKVNIKKLGSNWHQIDSTWLRPLKNDLKKYMDPNQNSKFQHLRLDSRVNVSSTELNKILKDKGILKGKGKAFINGAKKHNVNEAYLIAHASLETGNGTSKLSKGVKYKGKTVYNVYGIGAVDSDPVQQGAKKAYEEGWTTPEKAIEGGAKWIGKDYIHNEHKQNTLYKMRWNPNMYDGYAWKQYATDIGWAHKQTKQIETIYNQLDNPSYHYDKPKYK